MNGNWITPSNSKGQPSASTESPYRSLVVDSGPIIKQTGISSLLGKAQRYFTVPAVMQEIRDGKARAHLETLPWELEVRQPSPEAYQRVVDFSKLTGDYPSLSPVDLQVLALVVDLEQEGCLFLDHLRTTPKRTIGLGPIHQLNPQDSASSPAKEDARGGGVVEEFDSIDANGTIVEDTDSLNDIKTSTSSNLGELEPTAVLSPPSSWAKLVNPAQGSDSVQIIGDSIERITIDAAPKNGSEGNPSFEDSPDVESDLASEFPSLAAASVVPYEDEEDGNDDGNNVVGDEPECLQVDAGDSIAKMADSLAEEESERQRKKEEALKPISKSGKLHNSFRKYGKLMKPAPKKTFTKTKPATSLLNIVSDEDEGTDLDPSKSRILGAGGQMTSSAEDMKAEDDDGEGWITSTKDISTLKNQGGGRLEPGRSNLQNGHEAMRPIGPPRNQRTACTTTDFAMQNVLLQMGLHLLSVDGMQIRKLKSWVLRCGACFKVHTDPVDPKTGLRRMFCSHCGSDMMQRISASVDGKTGRLKLHFSKKYKHNLRGTKFSLPKAGSGDRFQGDLLLREDQMLMGAWNQKVKKNSGGQSRAHAQSIFGKDIASNVGCKASAAMPSDIRVGFGRRNPNSAKGRERRGKKKKSSDRACGLRRY